jgi:hypothetical protein
MAIPNMVEAPWRPTAAIRSELRTMMVSAEREAVVGAWSRAILRLAWLSVCASVVRPLDTPPTFE